eukprot:4196964-Pyramimonas_sp.AAC.1
MMEVAPTGSAMGSLGSAKDVMTTVIVSRGRGLTERLTEAPEGDLFAAREHRAFGDKLGSLQGQ